MSEKETNRMDECEVKDIPKGERLRLAREALGLEISEVAAKLYFDTRCILALEEDDYSIFSGSAYLYGYMRAYVKLLELPLDEFLGDLQNIEDKNEFHFESVDTDLDYQTRPAAKHRQWILPAVIGAVLVVAIIIFLLISADDSARAEAITWQTEDNVQGSQDLQRISIPLVVGGEVDTPADKVNREFALATTTGRNSTTGIGKSAASRPRLLLEYKTDSWTDIRDANGKRLVYRMVEKGNRLQLDSSPSYSILLGFSPGVNVSWDDRPFNLSEHERKNIAYFVVGDKSKTSSATLRQE